MRLLTTSFLTLAFLGMPARASAHDVKYKADISDLNLPTEAEIQKIVDDMPDLNALMDGMMAVAQDKDVRQSLEKTGEKLASKMEELADLEMRDNGLPDLNLMMETMLLTFSDEDVMGELLGVVEELQDTVEENFDEDLLRPERD
ncbi:MAG: hypothetical protein HKN36_03640 [Hellea sp.]|nr:hypothetical protein [Hellea sp.]